MKTQTEAERLAEILEQTDQMYPNADVSSVEVAAELRRLVSFNQQLMDEVARLKHPEPLPVKTYSGGKAWHVAPTQPLTDEQINQIIDSISMYRGEYSVAIARAIEAAHGITKDQK